MMCLALAGLGQLQGVVLCVKDDGEYTVRLAHRDACAPQAHPLGETDPTLNNADHNHTHGAGALSCTDTPLAWSSASVSADASAHLSDLISYASYGDACVLEASLFCMNVSPSRTVLPPLNLPTRFVGLPSTLLLI